MDAEQIRSIDVINGVISSIPGTEDPGDAGLSVTFKDHSHFDDVATREQGRPIFVMKEYVLITVPGDLTCNVFRPANERDHLRFPKQYLAYKAGREQVEGTPLTEVSWLSRAQCDELAYFRIQTVEQLASVSDGNAQKYMGLVTLRQRAQQYLQTIKEEKPFNEMQAQLATRDEQIATMQNQMQEMMTELARIREERAKADD